MDSSSSSSLQTGCRPGTPTSTDASGDKDPSSRPRVTEFLSDRTVCAWCNLSPANGESLKRCRGCEIVLYCGGECQAGAWPVHRTVCRSRGHAQARPATEIAGYATPIALSQVIKDWCRLHEFTMMVLVHSSLRSVGGVDANLRLGRAIFFILSSQRAESSPANEDPAQAFTLRAIQVVDGEGAQNFNRRRTAGQLPPDGDPTTTRLGFCGHSSETTQAGFVPVACHVEGSKFATTVQYPTFRAFHHSEDASPDQQMTTAFRDLVRVCQTFINHGVVLRSAPGLHPTTPLSGFMVRTRKGWTWQQDQRAWQQMDG